MAATHRREWAFVLAATARVAGAAAYREALALADADAERAFLTARLASLST